MDYCAPKGIPHSVFRKWRESDQEKVIAWLIDKADRHTCGSYPDEWLDENNRPLDPPPMFVRTSRCQGCIELGQVEDMIRKENNGSLPHGMDVYLSRQPPPPREDDDEEDEEDL